MRNNNCAWGSGVVIAGLLAVSGCATPEYAVRPAPTPVESPEMLQIERTISAYQAHDLEQHGVRRVEPGERLFGYEIPTLVDRLSRVTERPFIHYRVFLIPDQDPNAAALADGRLYVTIGLLQYLASRGSPVDELAFILSHEIGHTVAQHVVKRYEQLQRQQTMLALVGLGASAVTKGSGAADTVGALATDVASLINAAISSAYSQADELEADQLGARYCHRAGYDPRAALALLDDFSRFDNAGPFLRTHPYSQQRRDALARYFLEESWGESVAQRRAQLRQAQTLYPVGSQSWTNLQHQLDQLQ